MLSDGTVAIVRALDYHIDWLRTDGTMTSTPPMPFDRIPISPADKQRMIDSLQRRSSIPIPWKVRDIPDAHPPIVQHQVLADLEGNVWVLGSKPTSPTVGPVFDVVNRKGVIFERVQLPSERELAGFGPGGVIYMRFHPGIERVRLEWARVARSAAAQATHPTLEVDHVMIHVAVGAPERAALERAGFVVAPTVNHHDGQDQRR